MKDRPRLCEEPKVVELMAIETLRGDLDAARELACYLIDEIAPNASQKMSTNRVRIGQGRIQAVVHFPADFIIGDRQWNEIVQNTLAWIRGEKPVIGFMGVERIELFEMEEPVNPTVWYDAPENRSRTERHRLPPSLDDEERNRLADSLRTLSTEQLLALITQLEAGSLRISLDSTSQSEPGTKLDPGG